MGYAAGGSFVALVIYLLCFVSLRPPRLTIILPLKNRCDTAALEYSGA